MPANVINISTNISGLEDTKSDKKFNPRSVGTSFMADEYFTSGSFILPNFEWNSISRADPVDTAGASQVKKSFAAGETKNFNVEVLRPPSFSDASFSRPDRNSFIALQEWEGVVTEITDESFFARLVDRTDLQQLAVEKAEFPRSQISDDDSVLLAPGAIFRWSVGNKRLPGGRKMGSYEIVFRRLPRWTNEDIEAADSAADELADYFRHEPSLDDPS